MTFSVFLIVEIWIFYLSYCTINHLRRHLATMVAADTRQPPGNRYRAAHRWRPHPRPPSPQVRTAHLSPPAPPPATMMGTVAADTRQPPGNRYRADTPCSQSPWWLLSVTVAALIFASKRVRARARRGRA